MMSLVDAILLDISTIFGDVNRLKIVDSTSIVKISETERLLWRWNWLRWNAIIESVDIVVVDISIADVVETKDVCEFFRLVEENSTGWWRWWIGGG